MTNRDADLDERISSDTQKESEPSNDQVAEIAERNTDADELSKSHSPTERVDETFDPAVFSPPKQADGDVAEVGSTPNEQGDPAAVSERPTETHSSTERVDETFDPAVFSPPKQADGDVAEIGSTPNEQGNPAAVSERLTENTQGAELTKQSTEQTELKIPVQQFQLDEKPPEQVLATQQRDVEETAEAVVTTAYGSDIITKSLVPNDLGFDFNEVVQRIDEDLNLSAGWDNLYFSEPDIVIPDLAPIPGDVFDRHDVFKSATNLRLLDTSE